MYKSLLFKVILVFLVSTVFLILILASKTSAQSKILEGFISSEIRFDESMGDKRPTPKIPRGWRFIGVSNGEKANSNNLWFQDSSGNIYLLQGFVSYSKFILEERVQKISVGE